VNAQVQAMWTAELRSGRIAQGTGALLRKHDGTMCCLGVLCELHRQATGGPEWEDAPLSKEEPARPRILAYLSEPHYLPVEVQKWAGLTVKNPWCLANFNDYYGLTFSRIADLIELFDAQLPDGTGNIEAVEDAAGIIPRPLPKQVTQLGVLFEAPFAAPTTKPATNPEEALVG